MVRSAGRSGAARAAGSRSQAVVAYDHARHAPLGNVITLDFINVALEPGTRAGIELTLETAKELRAALDRAGRVRGGGSEGQGGPCPVSQRETRDEPGVTVLPNGGHAGGLIKARLRWPPASP